MSTGTNVFWLSIAIGSTLASPGFAERGLAPTDFYQEVALSDVAISPAGDRVAFTVMTIDEEKNRRHREICMQLLAGGAPVGGPFRFSSLTAESSDPRWSPDGTVLGFQSKRGDEDNQTWFLTTSAAGGEAYQIEGVSGAPIWSPDGQWIAFAHAAKDPKADEDHERIGWIAPDAISRTLDAERFDGRVVTSIRYKNDGTLPLEPHFDSVPKKDLYVVAARGGTARKLTTGDFNVSDITWSTNSEQLYFVANEKEDDELNRAFATDIYRIHRDGGTPQRLTPNPSNEQQPTISPDGSWMAYLYSKERGAQTDLMIVRLADNGAFGGVPRSLTGAWDLRPGNLSWSSNQTVRFTAGVGGDAHWFEVEKDNPSPRQLTNGERRLGHLSASLRGQVVAYTVTDAVTPTELYASGLDGSGEIRLSHFNDAWLSEVGLVAPENLKWKVADGSTIEGWVVKPVDYQPGKKYPMVLKIHGGPHGAYGNTFFRTFHVLSARGFFVLYPNPRGSTGYGHDFTYATRGKWGEMDSEDYLGGVDAALARYPDIDSTRIGVSGGSYGGYMTNWLSATTDRFAAAVTSRSISNWESWYGNSDAQGLTEYEFFGPPWEQRELYRRLSPISYVENVTIPTLIIHSEQDWRTPIGDGEQWFMALKKRNVPVELVRYPRSSHGLSRTGEPWLLVDRLERLSSWFEYWLIDQPGATDNEQ